MKICGYETCRRRRVYYVCINEIIVYFFFTNFPEKINIIIVVLNKLPLLLPVAVKYT